MAIEPGRTALVFAFDDRFVGGAEVLMFSFLRYNPWFKGDWICISDGISEASQRRLTKLYPVRVLSVDPRLHERTARVSALDPGQKGREAIFYSLQVFSLRGYERVVYLDTDMLCVGDCSALFGPDAPDFGVAPDDVSLDPWFPQLRSRWAKDLSMNHWRYGQELKQSFNSGVFTLSARYLTDAVFEELLADPFFDGPRAFDEGESTLDQYILNKHFGDYAVDVGCIYNWPIYMDDLLQAAFGKTFQDARLYHYAGVVKPWQMEAREIPAKVPWREVPYYLAWHALSEAMHGQPAKEEAVRLYRERAWQHAWLRPLHRRLMEHWRRLKRGLRRKKSG